jgi:L-alanine-DL-glutamate epimerase-like enolase superfamily enzyme
MTARSLTATSQRWPLKEAFTISRGSKTEAHVIVVTAREGSFVGRGEAVPYARYGETIEGALAQIATLPPDIDRATLQQVMPAGAARNAVDCALFELEAKRSRISAAQIAGFATIEPLLTAFTISLDTPDVMARKAAAAAHLPLLKLKLGGAGDDARMLAVRHARPDARLIADANEAWTANILPALMAAAAQARIELIEQPLPESSDAMLAAIPHPVPICADESLHTRNGLAQLRNRYDAINIKLDKAGGLTEALALKHEAQLLGFRIMAGSMVATSLAVAPAMILAQGASWCDLDGPLLLARDRTPPIIIRDGIMSPPDPALWG